MMNISELLRTLADKLDGIENNKDATATHIDNTVDARIENQEKAEKAKEELGDFIPPLQQKIELLKKAVDVDNYYDEDEDELCSIKRIAGISPNVAAIMSLSDDEPLDN